MISLWEKLWQCSYLIITWLGVGILKEYLQQLTIALGEQTLKLLLVPFSDFISRGQKFWLGYMVSLLDT